jgi:5-(carboxyamino)imidazole ribonucleotide synthase
MVNLVGEVRNDHNLLEDESDATVHLYGKKPRPGRKIGHVTAVADSPPVAVERAVEIADRLRAERVAS